MSITISDLVSQSHATAINKGWWDEPRSFGDLIALIHSELSEALEEYRSGRDVKLIYTPFSADKPEGVPIELADTLIRIADLAGEYGINLDEALEIKLAYNKKRPHRHGGKII